MDFRDSPEMPPVPSPPRLSTMDYRRKSPTPDKKRRRWSRSRSRSRSRSHRRSRSSDRDKDWDRDRERGRDRDKDYERDRERDRPRDIERERERDINRDKDRDINRDKDRDVNRDRERDRDSYRDREREKVKDSDREKLKKYSRRSRSRSRERRRSRSRSKERNRSKETSNNSQKRNAKDNRKSHKKQLVSTLSKTYPNNSYPATPMSSTAAMLGGASMMAQSYFPVQSNAFKNDGSFMEMFKKMQEQVPVIEPHPTSSVVLEEKPVAPPPLMVGKRRGGRILKTGMVAKPKVEAPVEEKPKDAWALYMQEVKKYREVCCQEEDNTRPLVK